MPYVVIVVLSSLSWLLLYVGYSGQFTITPESYPADVRSFGQSLSNVCGRTGAIINSLVLGALLSLGFFEVAISIIACEMIGEGLVAMTIPETKGSDADRHLSFSE